MYCVQEISIKPNLSSGINSFTVYATNNYRKLCVHRYDTVEVMYEDGLKFVQVHGIINIQLGNDRSHILLIVHPLKKAMKNRTDHLLPFDIYIYDFVYQSCPWDNIEPSMIYRPAILMPCCDRFNGFNASSFSYQMARNLRLWIIPYRSVDANGYDIGDVDEPE
jgi:hypothetical protein